MDSEIDRITNSTQYNGSTLLRGGVTASIFHIGPNESPTADQTNYTITAVDSTNLTINGLLVDTGANALLAVAGLDAAIGSVNNMRSDVGALVNRLEHTIDNLSNQRHNMQAAESVIRDVDFAIETTEFTKAQILMQSGTAMLAQANVRPQSVLQLLR